MTSIPQWALDKASDLASKVFRGDTLDAFAKYIAENEEEPVDPLLIEARKIAQKVSDSWLQDESYLNGDFDRGEPIKFIRERLAALKSREEKS